MKIKRIDYILSGVILVLIYGIICQIGSIREIQRRPAKVNPLPPIDLTTK